MLAAWRRARPEGKGLAPGGGGGDGGYPGPAYDDEDRAGEGPPGAPRGGRGADGSASLQQPRLSGSSSGDSGTKTTAPPRELAPSESQPPRHGVNLRAAQALGPPRGVGRGTEPQSRLSSVSVRAAQALGLPRSEGRGTEAPPGRSGVSGRTATSSEEKEVEEEEEGGEEQREQEGAEDVGEEEQKWPRGRDGRIRSSSARGSARAPPLTPEEIAALPLVDDTDPNLPPMPVLTRGRSCELMDYVRHTGLTSLKHLLMSNPTGILLTALGTSSGRSGEGQGGGRGPGGRGGMTGGWGEDDLGGWEGPAGHGGKRGVGKGGEGGTERGAGGKGGGGTGPGVGGRAWQEVGGRAWLVATMVGEGGGTGHIGAGGAGLYVRVCVWVCV